MNNKFWIVSMPTYSMIIFIILNIIAMACYPGGNLNDPSQVGYFFRYNFWSYKRNGSSSFFCNSSNF